MDRIDGCAWFFAGDKVGYGLYNAVAYDAGKFDDDAVERGKRRAQCNAATRSVGAHGYAVVPCHANTVAQHRAAAVEHGRLEARPADVDCHGARPGIRTAFGFEGVVLGGAFDFAPPG